MSFHCSGLLAIKNIYGTIGSKFCIRAKYDWNTALDVLKFWNLNSHDSAFCKTVYNIFIWLLAASDCKLPLIVSSMK